MYGFAPCSNGRRMFRPIVLPPASRAPRLAASMMPGPPPDVTTKRWLSDCSEGSSASAAAPAPAPPRSTAPTRRAFRAFLQLLARSARRRRARRGRAASRSARSARSRLSTRADPKKTTVSWIFCFLEAPQRLEVFRRECGSAALRHSRGTPDTGTPTAAEPYVFPLFNPFLLIARERVAHVRSGQASGSMRTDQRCLCIGTARQVDSVTQSIDAPRTPT